METTIKQLTWVIIFLAAALAASAVPYNLTIPFQMFNASTGTALNGTHTITFRAYENPTGGTSINETARVSFFNGVGHTVLAANVSSLRPEVQYWWTFTVGGGTESSLRIADTPVRQSLYALNASWAAQAGNSSSVNWNAIKDVASSWLGNSTGNATGVGCGGISNAASNLCTIVDTDTNTGTGVKITVIGGDAGLNASALTNDTAINISGQVGGITTNLVGKVVNLVMAVANSIITSFTKEITFQAGIISTTINASTSVNSTTFYGSLTGKASNATFSDNAGNATFAASSGNSTFSVFASNTSNSSFAISASGILCGGVSGAASNLCTILTNQFEFAFTKIGGTQGSNFSALSNDTALNITLNNGNVSISGNQIMINYTPGLNQFENAITTIGGTQGTNFSASTNNSAINFTLTGGNVSVVGSQIVFNYTSLSLDNLSQVNITLYNQLIAANLSVVNYVNNMLSLNITAANNSVIAYTSQNNNSVTSYINLVNSSLSNAIITTNTTMTNYIDSRRNLTVLNLTDSLLSTAGIGFVDENISIINKSVGQYCIFIWTSSLCNNGTNLVITG